MIGRLLGKTVIESNMAYCGIDSCLAFNHSRKEANRSPTFTNRDSLNRPLLALGFLSSCCVRVTSISSL